MTCYPGCCQTGVIVRRRYRTKQERIDRLEAYAEALEKELEGVQERIEELGAEA